MADDLLLRSQVSQLRDMLASVQVDLGESRRHIERSIDAFRSSVNGFFEAHNRDTIAQKRHIENLNEIVTTIERHLNQSLATVEQRLDTLNQSLAPQAGLLDSLNQSIAAVDPHLSHLDERLATIGPRLDSLIQQNNARFNSLDQRVAELDQHHHHDRQYDVLFTQIRDVKTELRSR